MEDTANTFVEQTEKNDGNGPKYLWHKWNQGDKEMFSLAKVSDVEEYAAQERDRAVRERDEAWEARMAEKVSREVRKALDEVEKARKPTGNDYSSADVLDRIDAKVLQLREGLTNG